MNEQQCIENSLVYKNKRFVYFQKCTEFISISMKNTKVQYQVAIVYADLKQFAPPPPAFFFTVK